MIVWLVIEMSSDLVPGELDPGDGIVRINDGRETATVTVGNTGDRPIQVGSHFHFFEANRALEFDRRVAFGMRLDVPAGTAVRFEPGDVREVDLVAFGGNERLVGMNGLADGTTTDGDAESALDRAREEGFAITDAATTTDEQTGDGE